MTKSIVQPAPMLANRMNVHAEFALDVIQDGETFRVLAPALARALGHREAFDMLRNLPAVEKGSVLVRTPGGEQRVGYVTEAGFYRALGQRQAARVADDATRAQVERFQSWVYSEVLPSIRRHGGYLTPEAIEKTLSDPDFIIGLATALKAEQSKRAEAEARAAILAPKADAFDAFLSTVGDLSMNEAAKEVSRGSGVIIGEHRLRDAMIRWGWVYRDGANKPRAYQAQIDCGRLAEKPQWHYRPSSGEKVLDTPQVRVTAKGVKAAADRLAHDRAEVSA